jgi:hypothetical protein
VVLGDGKEGLADAGAAANHGAFTIGIWKNPTASKHGHVAIITSYFKLLGMKPEQHAVGAWGQLNKIGHLFEQISKSFGAGKHAHVRYAKSLMPIL